MDKYSEIALLYELSLTNLKYYEPEENAKGFIQKLISRKGLNYGAVWQYQSSTEEEMHYKLLYGLPALSEHATLAVESYEEILQNNGLLISEKSLFNHQNLNGYFAYFGMADVGILELFVKNNDQKLSYDKLISLKDVVNQLAVSIKSSQSYLHLQKEVTMRQEAQRLLRANEEKFQSIINNVQLGLLEVDLNEKIIYANKAFCELTGYSLNELKGKNASKLFVKDKAMRKMVEEQNANRTDGDSGAYEVPIIDKYGKKKYIIISGAPNYDEKGNIIGSIGIHLDITEQKKLGIENEFKDLRIKKLFDISLDALVSMNEQGNIFEWSKQAENIFHYTAEEAINRKLSDLIIPEKYREAHDKGMEKFHETGEGPVLNKRFEITAIRKGGEEFPIELTIFPIEYEGFFYFTSFIRDISELKNSRESMQKALEEQKKLNEMKTKFISMTSHELRTPLTTIKSNTEILNYLIENSDSIDPSKISKNVKRMDHNILRLNQLIDNILLIGKIGSGKVNFNPVPTDMQDFIDHSVFPNLVKKPTLESTGKPFLVSIDHGLFTQVLNNLVENAFKYSPESNKKPIVSMHFKPTHLELHVQDFGIGIPEKEQENLFDTFFRASNVDNIQGTGLGLAIVKDFVNLHDGNISVKSIPEQGSTFIVSLPKLNA